MKKILLVITLFVFCKCSDDKKQSSNYFINADTVLKSKIRSDTIKVSERYFMVGYITLTAPFSGVNWHYGQYFFKLDTFPTYSTAKKFVFDFIADKEVNFKKLSILSINEFKNKEELLKFMQ